MDLLLIFLNIKDKYALEFSGGVFNIGIIVALIMDDFGPQLVSYLLARNMHNMCKNAHLWNKWANITWFDHMVEYVLLLFLFHILL